MTDKMRSALLQIGGLDLDDALVLRRRISEEDFKKVANSSVAIHDETPEIEFHAAKSFNAPVQVVMKAASGDMFELGCEHEWKTQGSSIRSRGIMDYRCSKCGATYTYDSSD